MAKPLSILEVPASTVDKALKAKAAQAGKTGGEEEKPYKYPEGWKKPKTLGFAADALWNTRNARLAMQKQVDELEAMENALKHHLIENLPKSDAGGVSGHLARVTVTTKDVPRVEDWGKVYAAIVASYTKHAKKKDGQQDGAFAMLQRRLGEAMVKEKWEAGQIVEGVGKFTVVGVSINKV
jgi:hypothetical protein